MVCVYDVLGYDVGVVLLKCVLMMCWCEFVMWVLFECVCEGVCGDVSDGDGVVVMMMDVMCVFVV